ncbi:MAG: HepT-like ribonuclease domain-containing protein, partial [Bacteroidota bacterium]
MTREILYLTDILLSIEKIERYITGISFEEFMDDDLRIDGVSRNFEIIG